MVNWALPIKEINPTVTETLESSSTPAFDRRSHYRLPIRVPIFIKGTDRQGEEFFELTHTVNVSASGACFVCRRELQVDADLMVSIPAPLPSEPQESDEYDFKFPAKIVRVDNGTTHLSRKISVKFMKLLYDK